MVWVIAVDIAGQRQADSYILTAGTAGQQREITVGRPPAKLDVRPDIVVHEKSVSKVHAILRVELANGEGGAGSRLVVADRSRYGTSVNGVKMDAGGEQELHVGDRVALGPKTHLVVEELPLVLAVHPGHPQLEAVQDAARRAGAEITHMVDPRVTYVLHSPRETIWSGLVHGMLHGATLGDLAWLQQVAAAGLLTNALPQPPQPVSLSLLLGPGQPPTCVALPPPAAGRQLAGALSGFTLGFSSDWQDVGLAAALEELGARVVASAREAGSGANGVVRVAEAAAGSQGPGGALGSAQLLAAILAADAAALRSRVGEARASQAAAAAAPPTPQGGGAQAGPVQQAEEPEDSDMTQEADEEEEEAGAMEVEQRQGGAQATVAATQPAGAHQVGVQGADGAQAGASRRAEAATAQAADGWIVAAKRPAGDGTDAAAPTNAAAASPDVANQDAPPVKRRRLGSAPAASQPGPAGAGPSHVPPAGGAAVRSAPAAMHPATAPTNPNTTVAGTTIKQEAQEDNSVPWMTQQPHRGGARRSSVAPHAAPAVKPEPGGTPGPSTAAAAAAPVSKRGGAAGGKGGKSRGKKSAADAEELALEVPTRAAQQQQEQVPELLDSSAQVVLEVDLIAPSAPTPELTARRAGTDGRAGSAEPPGGSAEGLLGSGQSAGASGRDGDGGGYGEGVLPDYKRFRKQGAQLPPAAVQPLPVFMADSFRDTDEAQAFLRQEEERATKKRRADEAFNSAGAAAVKKPPRAPRRG